MTSFKEPNYSYTEATLRREVHTDNSHWELMYKAMLAQLMTYVDAAVARALAEHGIDETFTARAQAMARAAAQSYAAERDGGRPAPAGEAHRYDPSMGGFAGAALPPWLQPFTLPEQVRFTRTPDALLRHPHEAEPQGEDPVSAEAVPSWKKPVVLPANVRFNRTPDPKPFEAAGGPDETVGAQTFTGEAEAPRAEAATFEEPAEGVVIALADVQAERALAAAALSEADVALAGEPEATAHDAAVPEAALPAWFGFMRPEQPAGLRPADEQDNAGHLAEATEPAAVAATAPAAEPAVSHEDDLAAAWLRAHERTFAARDDHAAKGLRLDPEQSLGEVLAAVEAVALDPHASMHPYGEVAAPAGLAPAEPVAADAAMAEAAAAEPVAADAVAEPVIHHPYGDAAFWIEGLADPIRVAPEPVVEAEAVAPADEDLSAHPFGLAGLAVAEEMARAAAPTLALPAPDAGLPELLALPAPDWLLLPEPVVVPEPAVEPAAETVAEEFGPYGDPRLWADPVAEPVAEVAVEAPEPAAALPEMGPYGDASLWMSLVGAEAADVAEPETAEAVEPAAELAAPVPAAPAADARSFAGPIRSGIRRGLGTPHGLAPFELTNRVTTDPELYEDPPLDLLMLTPEPTGEVLSSGALEQNARLLEGVLEEFGIRGEIIDVRPGPVVTLYELEPAPGTKSSRVIGLADDIARSMSAVSARVAVVQGRNVIGIELPNTRRETVYLRELIAADEFTESKHKLAIALGKTIGGESVIVDLARMPHLLVAGTTGSGKSVAINTMILSILYQMRPEQCRLIMIDPKMLELSIYEGIPHLLTPVVTDPKKAVVALKWAVREMEDRYKKMAKVGVRNIDGFNARVVEAAEKGEVITRTIQTGFNRETGEPIFETEEMELSPLPYIVVIVDEMADLMMVAGKDIEGAIQRLAQMARAAGIHLIMATQRPSVDVITGTIKANFPTRISFQVTSKIDSRTILGEQGAEQLLGQGDMLYMAGGGRISRVHGPFVSDGEVEKVVKHLKCQGHPAYLDVVVAEEGDADKAEAAEDKPVFDKSAMAAAGGDDDADLYDQAVKVVLRDKKCSTSYIQRRLAVGYNKAASLVERMEKEGIVGQANNAGKREILVYSRDLRYTERDGDE
ncbi:DNA translocase FtsK [Lichenibacterium dinghuense]|uniref:DNA translocase FtsK n=1 Tax=Lichenibacterium dinghuense TaxID=2895977 RepID=UPI001F48D47F|nr:DNA translocase FtsK [Lichenibacterium sp. 6Y81]